MAPLEKTRLRLGIVRLTDCAPLVVAKERGFFAAEGLEVELSREPSWANIRDKVAVGALDGAQMPAPMPLAATLGADAVAAPMMTALALDLGGNAITVSSAAFQRLAETDPDGAARTPVPAAALARLIAADRTAGRPPLRLAVVYPFSTHGYELRAWLASAGIDPDRDVRLSVVPPPQMVGALSAGVIDGCCVGEPWNSLAVALGLGHVLATSGDIWAGRMEKVLAVTAAWAEAHPRTHLALLRAVLGAAQWTDEPGNRAEVAEIICQPHYLNVPQEAVAASLTGAFRHGRDEPVRMLPEFNRFHRHAANFPWRSQAEWYLGQMKRWGQLGAGVDVRAAAEAVFRPDLFRRAACALGMPVPPSDRKPEGAHAVPWLLETATTPIPMGADAFPGGCAFVPDAAAAEA